MKLEELYSIIEERKKTLPKGSYTASLFQQGLDRIIQKVGEEAVEVIIAAKGREKNRIISETADLLYMIGVLLAAKNISLESIYKELESRKSLVEDNESICR